MRIVTYRDAVLVTGGRLANRLCEDTTGSRARHRKSSQRLESRQPRGGLPVRPGPVDPCAGASAHQRGRARTSAQHCPCPQVMRLTPAPPNPHLVTSHAPRPACCGVQRTPDLDLISRTVLLCLWNIPNRNYSGSRFRTTYLARFLSHCICVICFSVFCWFLLVLFVFFRISSINRFENSVSNL